MSPPDRERESNAAWPPLPAWLANGCLVWAGFLFQSRPSTLWRRAYEAFTVTPVNPTVLIPAPSSAPILPLVPFREGRGVHETVSPRGKEAAPEESARAWLGGARSSRETQVSLAVGVTDPHSGAGNLPPSLELRRAGFEPGRRSPGFEPSSGRGDPQPKYRRAWAAERPSIENTQGQTGRPCVPHSHERRENDENPRGRGPARR